ncbi:hypothetical protein ATI61_106336 [Archangium gephyra]|uniref:PD-(D/E)XK endonuclease-like domain-containing protein n=1 Tax=Archangium gephyra TaxID=48 RepID=A0ABX9K0F1_9BACT|nr:hypothetical protein [Archangium gephyra]REG30866.1 hypothetical protein ATI61_106336 [Archangium gephyra]
MKTYKALTQPLPIDAVGPDGKKRPIQIFPKVGALKSPGLEAFKVYFPHFLKKRRGSDVLTPELGTSLHALLETEDEQLRAEIVRRVAHEEIPETFGRYLDAIRSFDVTVLPEARTMQVSLELKPHGAEWVSWSFELHFPPQEEGRTQEPVRPRPSPEAMSDPRTAELIRIARHYYPAGYPVWEDDDGDDHETEPAYRRTSEYQRWLTLRKQTCDGWKEWEEFLRRLRAVFSGHPVSDVTYPFADACSRCCVYLKTPLPDGGRVVTRVVGAVSILAPLYLVYVTTQRVGSDDTATRPQLEFTPTGEAKSFADTVARLIEQVFGYRPFPMELADIPLPDLRVESLHESATLLGALFADRGTLAHLP